MPKRRLVAGCASLANPQHAYSLNAAIVAALANDFDALDGAEQRAIADVLTAQAEETERDEAAARKLLGL